MVLLDFVSALAINLAICFSKPSKPHWTSKCYLPLDPYETAQGFAQRLAADAGRDFRTDEDDTPPSRQYTVDQVFVTDVYHCKRHGWSQHEFLVIRCCIDWPTGNDDPPTDSETFSLRIDRYSSGSPSTTAGDQLVDSSIHASNNDGGSLGQPGSQSPKPILAQDIVARVSKVKLDQENATVVEHIPCRGAHQLSLTEVMVAARAVSTKCTTYTLPNHQCRFYTTTVLKCLKKKMETKNPGPDGGQPRDETDPKDVDDDSASDPNTEPIQTTAQATGSARGPIRRCTEAEFAQYIWPEYKKLLNQAKEWREESQQAKRLIEESKMLTLESEKRIQASEKRIQASEKSIQASEKSVQESEKRIQESEKRVEELRKRLNLGAQEAE